MGTKKWKKPRETSRTRFAEVFHKPIEEFETIKKATGNLNESTKRGYYQVLPNYFIYLKMNPDQVIQLRRSDILDGNPDNEERFEQLTIGYAKNVLLKNKEYTGMAAQGVVGRIQGFFRNNSKRYALDMKQLKFPKKRKKKVTPSNEELRVMYGKADNSRDRLILCLMSQCGLAPVDVASLKIGDLPLEPWIYFEGARAKTGEVFRSATNPDIAYEVNAYLKVREGKNGDPLFEGREGILNGKAVSNAVRHLIEKAQLSKELRPYNLRDYFEDALVQAKVYSKVKESMMGHTSEVAHEYGSQAAMEAAIIEAAKKVYPLISLNGHKRGEIAAKTELAELKEMQSKFQTQMDQLADMTAQAMVFSYLQKPPEQRSTFIEGLKCISPQLFTDGRFYRILEAVRTEIGET